MWKAAEGIRAYDVVMDQILNLHISPILGFGDIPAVAKMLKMKGHNSQCPCRMCAIIGIKLQVRHLIPFLSSISKLF
jgi:hypothetical protein